MRTREHTFYSDGVRLDGLLQLPDRPATSGRYPAIVLCSGYQGLKELIPAKFWGPLTEAGFACFAFDYRGFGTSDGQRGRLLPEEWIEDIQNAVTFLQQQPELDPERVGLLGWGFGGGVVVSAAARDERVKAVACLNGVGDGGRAVRRASPPGAWETIQGWIAEDRVRRVLTGVSRLVSPWAVVPLDPVTQVVVTDEMYGEHDRFGTDVSLQSAEAYYAFRPELEADRISPRPLLLIHGARNGLHLVDEARSLYEYAGQPKELIELPDAVHLDWIQPGDPQREAIFARLIDWFAGHLQADPLPVQAGTAG
jgi:hypothetical protein